MAFRGSADLEAARRREFRRTVVLSGLLHVGAVGLSLALPAPAAVRPAGVITVDLVAAPPSVAPPRAAPAPTPAPAAQPKSKPKPKPKQKVLPKDPTERSTKPKPKPAKKPTPRREEVFLDPEPKQEKSLDELMAEMRGGEPTPEPVQTATAPAPSPGSGPGKPDSPAVAAWKRRTKAHVQRSWVVESGFRMQALETEVLVDLDAAGNVRGTEIVRRSGNPWYDEGVVRGITKASPLPAPPEPGEWPFVFTPEDSF